MLHIDIYPLLGIKIQNVGEVYLGQPRKDVENLIGPPDASDNIVIGYLSTDCAFYTTYELRIDYNKKGVIDFIEFIHGPFPTNVELRIYDTDPFKADANTLIEILSVHNSGEIDDTEAPYSYAFKNISVGIWRDSTPSDIQELIIEKQTNNTYIVDKIGLDEELKKSNRFWTIGIGERNYYNS